ncbi:hypothetical protein [Phenylobacterium sp.]|uniref:hypothetical protein n=1 Tax=Phenylobacterium sp. TaxID=1871053 RepID=UPI002737E2B6|nr:hypothetical protein [Phenylobacterium sp.]MDP3869169.1 hypothetical protein [Phenylobacterium sp.]
MTTDTLSETEEQTRKRIREAKLRARLDEHQRAARLNEPLRDPVTVAALAELADDARMKRAEAESLRLIGAKTYRAQIHKLEAEARKLDDKAEKLRREELEQDRLYGEAKEPILMAKARGAEIIAGDVEIAEVARDEHGARIIHRRGPQKGLPALVYTRATRAEKLDGIKHAYYRGHLSTHGKAVALRLRAVGLAYQGAVAAANPLKAVDPGATAGGGCQPGRPGVKANEAAEWLRIARKELSPRQRAVLDKVCGEGFTVGAAAGEMRAGVPATARALRGGLAQAAESHRAAMAKGEATWVGAQLAFGVKAVAGVRA